MIQRPVISHPHVELCDPIVGSPTIRGTKIPVRRLWAWFRRGTSVETLLKRYPSLGPARVLDALAFAFDNQELIERDLAREQEALKSAGEESKAPLIQTKLPFIE